MKSLSEIETAAKRASRAAGFEWGIAEEVGKNIRMLEMLDTKLFVELKLLLQNVRFRSCIIIKNKKIKVHSLNFVP